jgi:hypothetical protein
MEKKILIFIIILFAASSVWLFSASDSLINSGRRDWSLSFSEPTSENLNFIVENYSEKNEFHWAILSGRDKLQEGNAKIRKNTKQEIIPDQWEKRNLKNRKIIIRVSVGDEMKEIFKNFEK